MNKEPHNFLAVPRQGGEVAGAAAAANAGVAAEVL